MSADPLLIAATAARNKAFAPFSNFKVGAKYSMEVRSLVRERHTGIVNRI